MRAFYVLYTSFARFSLIGFIVMALLPFHHFLYLRVFARTAKFLHSDQGWDAPLY